jgi:hypothetical protein
MWHIGGGVEQVIYAVTGIRPYYGAAVGPRMRFTVPNHQYDICATYQRGGEKKRTWPCLSLETRRQACRA